MSTKGLSVAQQEAILSETALLDTTGKLTTAELEAILVNKKRNKDQAEALLINAGVITSETAEATATNVVTAAKLKELVQTKALTQAEADLIAAKAGVTLANQKESVSLLAGIGSKIKGAGTALKGLGTGILTIASAHPVIAGITAAIALCGGAAIVNKVKQEKAAKAIKEAYENAKTAIDDINNTFNENSSKTKEIAKEYAELAQGVNLLTNENKKLSTEKYERFLDLSNQLSALYPPLTKSYDENGNAILDLSGDVDTIVGSLDDLIERQRALADQEIVEQMPDLFKGYSNNVTDYKEQLEDAEKTQEDIQKAYDVLNSWDGSTVWWSNGGQVVQGADNAIRSVSDYTNALDSLGIKYKQVAVDLDNDLYHNNDGYSIEADYNEFGTELHDIYVDRFNKAVDDVKYAKMQLESETSSINQYLNTWLQTEFSYNQLEDTGLQKAVQETLFNFDWNSLPENVDKNDWEAVSEYLRRNILFSINNIDDTKVSKALADIYTDNLNSDKLLEAIAKVQECFGDEHPISISLQTKVDDVQPLINNVKDKLQGTEFDDKVGELSLGDLKIAADLEVEDDTIKSWDELIECIEKAKSETFNNETDIFSSLSESQSSAIKSYQDTLSSITDIFENFKATDISDLMTTFTDYDWSAYLSGAEDLDTALRKIATQSLQAVISQMEGLEGCEPILDELKQKFNDTFNFDFDLSENLAAYNELTALLERVRKGGELNKKEIADLINRYPELASAIQDTTEGYKLEESAVVSLTNKYVESVNTGIAAQVRTTESVIEATSARIQSYRDEYEAYAKILNMYATGNDYRNGSYNADRQGELLKYGTSDFDRVIAEEEKALEEFRQKLSFKTKTETSDSSSGSGSSSSSSTSDFSDPIDWAAQSLDVLERRVSAAQTALDNTKGYQAQIEAINKLIKEQEKLASGYDEAQKVYQTKYNTALSTGVIADQGLSDAVRKQIEGGKTFRIEDFIDKNVASGDTGIREQLHDAVTDAVSWYNKANDAGDNAIKVQAEIDEAAFTKLELQIEEWEKRSDLSQSRIDLYTESLSTQERFGSELVEQEKKRYSLLIQQARAEKDYSKVKQLEVEQQKTLLQLTKEHFDRIQNYYDNRLGSLNAKTGKMNAAIDLIEAEGSAAGIGYYHRLNSINQYSIDYLETERDRLREVMGSIRLYTDEWYEALQALNDVEQQILELNAGVAENNNRIRQLEWERFDQLSDKIQSLNNERDFLNALLDSYGRIDEATGRLTSYGVTSQALNLANYDTYMYQAEQIAREIASLDSGYADDKNNSFYLERREELISQRNDAIQAAQAEKETVIDLVIEGINAEIDATEKLVNAKKEALSAEQDLHDYQKSIVEKTQDIAMIQRQINALEGDDSLENQKKLRELRSQLADAKDDLEETQYDHSISEQQDALDKMLEDYKASMEEYMKDTDVLFAKSIAQVNAESDTVAEILSDVAGSVGYSISENVIEPWKESTDVISNYADTFSDASASIITRLGLMKSAWEEMNKQVDLYSRNTTSSLFAEDKADHVTGSAGSNNNSGGDITSSDSSIGNILAKVKQICANASVKAGSRAGTELNRYILEYQDILGGNGNKLSWSQMVSLADVLGIKTSVKQVSDTKETGKAVRKAILDKLRMITGFNTGGVVQAMEKDDGLVKLKVGETVLTDKFTALLPNAVEAMKNLPPLMPNYLDKLKLVKSNPIQQFSVGDISIHLDGSNVIDQKTFSDCLDKNKEYIQHMVWDVPLGKGSLNYNKYK